MPTASEILPHSVRRSGSPGRKSCLVRTVRKHNHAWFDDVVQRLKFEREARRQRRPFESRIAGRPRRARYQFPIDVPAYDDRRIVTVTFKSVRSPAFPTVHIDGPVCLRHRWEDGSLCMWHDTDPPEGRWTLEDGLAGLMNHAAEHAWCEAECRAGRPWPKPESPGEHPRKPDCPSCPRQS